MRVPDIPAQGIGYSYPRVLGVSNYFLTFAVVKIWLSVMTSSQEYIEIKTLGSNASQRLSLSDCSLAFNLILPPPLKINTFLRGIEVGALHDDMRHVVCLFCYVQS